MVCHTWLYPETPEQVVSHRHFALTLLHVLVVRHIVCRLHTPS